MERFLFVMLAAVLVSCGSVPHEIVTANAVERQAAEALARDEARIIKGYDVEVRRLAGALLDAQRAAKIRAAAIAAVPTARLAAIDAARDAAVAGGKPFAEADAARTAALNAAASEVSVPLSALEAIDAECAAERAGIMTRWEAKREEFLAAPNRTILMDMNATLGRYLGSLDESARALEEIIGKGKEISK